MELSRRCTRSDKLELHDACFRLLSELSFNRDSVVGLFEEFLLGFKRKEKVITEDLDRSEDA